MTSHPLFLNRCFDKGRLRSLILWMLSIRGEQATLSMIEGLQQVGFHFATKAGASLGLDDLEIPPTKGSFMAEVEGEVEHSQLTFQRGEITPVESFQQLIESWHSTSERLRIEVVDHFQSTNLLNPVYMMAFSGARGNISQVRQLVGMRGLMADPTGELVGFPIRSNFREGLTLTEYMISCYGARKGLVDTAIKTADAGYLTRRLVDVSHHVIVKFIACGTKRSISLRDMESAGKIVLPLKDRLIGRVLAEPLHPLAAPKQEISDQLARSISLLRKEVKVRSPLTCAARHGICQLCYGWSLSQGQLVMLGEAVGVIAAQSIGEPGTQLTMRTFHTGGVFSGDLISEIRAPHSGKVSFPAPLQGSLVRTSHGKVAFFTKQAGTLFLLHPLPPFGKQSLPGKGYQAGVEAGPQDKTLTEIPLPLSTLLLVRHQEEVYQGQLLAELSPLENETNERLKGKKTLFSSFSGKVQVVDPKQDQEEKVFETEWGKEDELLDAEWGEEGELLETGKREEDDIEEKAELVDPMNKEPSNVTTRRYSNVGFIWITSGSDFTHTLFLPPYKRGSHLVDANSLISMCPGADFNHSPPSGEVSGGQGWQAPPLLPSGEVSGGQGWQAPRPTLPPYTKQRLRRGSAPFRGESQQLGNRKAWLAKSNLFQERDNPFLAPGDRWWKGGKREQAAQPVACPLIPLAYRYGWGHCLSFLPHPSRDGEVGDRWLLREGLSHKEGGGLVFDPGKGVVGTPSPFSSTSHPSKAGVSAQLTDLTNDQVALRSAMEWELRVQVGIGLVDPPGRGKRKHGSARMVAVWCPSRYKTRGGGVLRYDKRYLIGPGEGGSLVWLPSAGWGLSRYVPCWGASPPSPLSSKQAPPPGNPSSSYPSFAGVRGKVALWTLSPSPPHLSVSPSRYPAFTPQSLSPSSYLASSADTPALLWLREIDHSRESSALSLSNPLNLPLTPSPYPLFGIASSNPSFDRVDGERESQTGTRERAFFQRKALSRGPFFGKKPLAMASRRETSPPWIWVSLKSRWQGWVEGGVVIARRKNLQGETASLLSKKGAWSLLSAEPSVDRGLLHGTISYPSTKRQALLAKRKAGWKKGIGLFTPTLQKVTLGHKRVTQIQGGGKRQAEFAGYPVHCSKRMATNPLMRVNLLPLAREGVKEDSPLGTVRENPLGRGKGLVLPNLPFPLLEQREALTPSLGSLLCKAAKGIGKKDLPPQEGGRGAFEPSPSLGRLGLPVKEHKGGVTAYPSPHSRGHGGSLSLKVRKGWVYLPNLERDSLTFWGLDAGASFFPPGTRLMEGVLLDQWAVCVNGLPAAPSIYPVRSRTGKEGAERPVARGKGKGLRGLLGLRLKERSFQHVTPFPLSASRHPSLVGVTACSPLKGRREGGSKVREISRLQPQAWQWPERWASWGRPGLHVHSKEMLLFLRQALWTEHGWGYPLEVEEGKEGSLPSLQSVAAVHPRFAQVVMPRPIPPDQEGLLGGEGLLTPSPPLIPLFAFKTQVLIQPFHSSTVRKDALLKGEERHASPSLPPGGVGMKDGWPAELTHPSGEGRLFVIIQKPLLCSLPQLRQPKQQLSQQIRETKRGWVGHEGMGGQPFLGCPGVEYQVSHLLHPPAPSSGSLPSLSCHPIYLLRFVVSLPPPATHSLRLASIPARFARVIAKSPPKGGSEGDVRLVLSAQPPSFGCTLVSPFELRGGTLFSGLSPLQPLPGFSKGFDLSLTPLSSKGEGQGRAGLSLPLASGERGLGIPACLTGEMVSHEMVSFVSMKKEEWPSQKRESSLLSLSDQVTLVCSGAWQHVSVGQHLRQGDRISSKGAVDLSGQVLSIERSKVTLRRAQLVLLSPVKGCAKHVKTGQWVEKGAPLLTLNYQKVVTGDIVQGIPKIEQLFEASTKRRGKEIANSPQLVTQRLFQGYKRSYPLMQAVRRSLSEAQAILVEGVQRVYLSQGVLISDKHVEIVVRGMTSRVMVLDAGSTGLLPGESFPLRAVESVNMTSYGRKADYEPVLTGITNASLNSESFLSAASFQETTRVLSRSTLAHRTDFLRGLKEKVILGGVIKAGTGIDSNLTYGLLSMEEEEVQVEVEGEVEVEREVQGAVSGEEGFRPGQRE